MENNGLILGITIMKVSINQKELPLLCVEIKILIMVYMNTKISDSSQLMEEDFLHPNLIITTLLLKSPITLNMKMMINK
jgi:hypothetical protein